MKTRNVDLYVSDRAVLRYLERRHGMDIEAIRGHLASKAINAARLGAISLQVENVRLILRDNDAVDGRTQVWVVTVDTMTKRWGLGSERQRDG